MRFNKRTTISFFMFLVFLNFTVRYYLLGTHEEGADSFLIHSLANTITTYGNAKWIIHPLSYFGLTPLSYPCAVPYLLSGISQISGVNMETSVLIFSFTSSIIGLGAAYVMAMEIKRDHIFAFTIAFIFSLAPIFVEFTMWEATTRTLFIAFLPILVWSLLRTYGDQPKKGINIFMCILFFTMLGTIHHMFLMLPLFLIAYFTSLFIYNRVIKKITKEHWAFRYQTLIFIIVLIIFFLPQFSHQGIYSTTSWQKYQTGMFFNGEEKYIIFLNMLVDYWSRIGLFGFLGLIGLIALVYHPKKKIIDDIKRYRFKKSQNEIFVIVCLLATIPFVTMGIYVSLIFLPFYSIIIGYAMVRIIKILRRNKHILRVFVIIFILTSVNFTIFMNHHWNQSITSQQASEHTYSASIYLNKHFDNTTLSNDGLFAARISAFSEMPCLPLGGPHAAWYPPDLLVYDFADVEDYTFSRLSFDAVILTQSDYLYTTNFGINANKDWNSLMRSETNDKNNYPLYDRYEIEQVIEYLPHEHKYYYWSERKSDFMRSLDDNNYILYDNGEARIWLL
ncbi:MAG: hypothetical protein JSV49_11745 [Thermoplasmata archaeon]|nr:MAG: hypothetical protein JSV49_11745 [Thermoplasmata archaeon]